MFSNDFFSFTFLERAFTNVIKVNLWTRPSLRTHRRLAAQYNLFHRYFLNIAVLYIGAVQKILSVLMLYIHSKPHSPWLSPSLKGKNKQNNPESCKNQHRLLRICESIVQLCPFLLFYGGCFANFLYCRSDPRGQTEPREDDKSDHSRVSPRLRDNPAVCHLNSFGGGRALAGER